MVDYTKTMNRRVSPSREHWRDLEPVGREFGSGLEDDLLIVKDYAQDQAYMARQAGFEKPFDLEKERARMAALQEKMNPVVEEGGGDYVPPEEVVQQQEAVSLQVDRLLEEEEFDEEEIVVKKVNEFIALAEELPHPLAGMSQVKMVDVDAFKEALQEEHPTVHLDETVVADAGLTRKPTLQERLREIEASQEKHLDELERLERSDEFSL